MPASGVVEALHRARGNADRRRRGIDIQPHTQLVDSLLAIYKALGLKRQARQTRLSDYLKKGEPTITTNGK